MLQYICDVCGDKIPKTKFYFCSTCMYDLCEYCHDEHNKEHKTKQIKHALDSKETLVDTRRNRNHRRD